MIEQKVLTTKVARIVRETADAVTLRLDLQGRTFEYKPGMAVNIDPHQFGALRERIRDREERLGRREPPRAFSLASTPLDPGIIEVTAKVEASSDPPPLLTPYFLDGLREGDAVEVQGPFGLFVLPEPLPGEIDGLLFICAGSGVAPCRGILKHCLKAGWPLKHLFLVQNKTASDIIYREELARLAREKTERLRVVHVLSRERVDGMDHGYIGEELLRREMQDFLAPERALAFVCGPNKPRGNHPVGLVDAFSGDRRNRKPGILGRLGFPFERIIRETW